MRKPPPVETQFQPGHAKVGGAKKGAHYTTKAFRDALLEHWREHGDEYLRIIGKEEPATIMKTLASLCPKEFEINPSALAELTDEQLGIIAGLLRSRRGNDPPGDRGGEKETQH